MVLSAAVNKHGVAMALLLSFCGLLRVSEALRLRHMDVLLPLQHRGGSFVVLLLGRTKQGGSHSDKVVIDHPEVIKFIEKYTMKFPGPGPSAFCKTSYAQVRYWMRRLLPTLGFAADAFKSHSCRRGGASALSLQGVALKDVMLAGRWSSETSCRLYLRKAEVSLTRFMHGIDDHRWQLICSIARIGSRILDTSS